MGERHYNCQDFCEKWAHVRTNEKTDLKEITFVLRYEEWMNTSIFSDKLWISADKVFTCFVFLSPVTINSAFHLVNEKYLLNEDISVLPQYLSYHSKDWFWRYTMRGTPKWVCLPVHATKRLCKQGHLFLINLGIFLLASGVDGNPCCILANHVMFTDTTEVGYNNVVVTFDHHPKGFFPSRS